MRASSTKPLQLTVFGVPALLYGDGVLDLSRKPMALLLLLALDEPLSSRDRLAYLLWPEEDQSSARQNLRRLLSRLRATLRDACNIDPIATHGQDQIHFDHELCGVDVLEFRRLAQQAIQAQGTGRIAPADQALALVHAAPFDGFALDDTPPFEEWMQRQIAHLDQLHQQILSLIVETHRDNGKFPEAIRAATALVEADPLNEESHCALIELLLRTGQRDAAMQQYEACRVLLADELGVEPLPRTQALLAAAQTGGEGVTFTPHTSLAVRQEAAPPLPNSQRDNLPAAATSLIGRNREIAAVKALLSRFTVRLVTLTGPGGIGKTRLSLAVAADLVDEYEHGVFLVQLAPIHNAELVASMIAQTLGIRPGADQSYLDALKAYLRPRQMLLVLDNFEQVIHAGPLVAELLADAPGLNVLITSRALLRIYGEREFAVQPLTLPDRQEMPTSTVLAELPAVALFVERARSVQADFMLTVENARDVAEICIRLDGLPLAIELAAARIRFFSPQQMLARLDKRLALLTHGARDWPDRHRTLRATIEWSFNLLSAAEQRIFARLAVFVGGWTLDLAETVCADDDGEPDFDILNGLESLLDQSLVHRSEDENGEARFTMLETIREYALERLNASNEAERLHRAHADAFLALAAHAGNFLDGPQQRRWLDRLQIEQENFRAALQFAIKTEDASLALGLCSYLWAYWYRRGQQSEGRPWARAALALPDAAGDLVRRAIVLYGAGVMAVTQGDIDEAERLAEEGLQRAMQAEDDEATGRLLNLLASVSQHRGNWEKAAACYRQGLAIFRRKGDTYLTAILLGNLGNVYLNDKQYTEARAHYEESLALHRQINDTHGIATLLGQVGLIMRYLGEYDQAVALHREALALHSELGERQRVAVCLRNLGDDMFAQDKFDEATHLYRQALAYFHEIGDRLGIAESVHRLARLLGQHGKLAEAVRLYSAADTLRKQAGARSLSFGGEHFVEPLQQIRRQMNEDDFAQSWAKGEAMPLEQVIKAAEAVTSF